MVDVAKASEHVTDAKVFELPFGIEIHIPQPPPIFGYQFTITKFMILELIVAILMAAIFISLARRISGEDFTPDQPRTLVQPARCPTER